MKKFTILSLGVLAAMAPLWAQENNRPQPGAPGKGGPPWKQHGKMHGLPPDAGLTPDEQQRLQAAREKAKQDPTVRSLDEARKALNDQFETAMRAAMLAADSSLGPILDKIKAARDRAKEMRGNFESLTPEQKQQLKAARQAAKDDPAVQAAREKMQEAQGPDAKREAAKEMHEAVKAAMLKAEPSLGSLIEKLGPAAFGPPHKRGPGGPGGPDGPEGHGGPRPPEMDGPPDDGGI